MKTIFCTLMDDNFFEGFRVFFLSLLKHNPGFSYFFHILDNGISNHVKKKMTDIYPYLEFYEIERSRYEIPDGKTIKSLSATYYKLEIFNPKFIRDYERIIFMDMDILIQGDLDKLTRIDLEGKPLGSCQQFNSKEDKLIKEINSGVLVLDPSKFRENLFEDLLERVKVGAYLPDQEIINREFIDSDQFVHLPKIYNVEKRMLHSKKLSKIYKEAICIHYVHTKPWQEKSKKENLFKEVYQKWWAYDEENFLEEKGLDLLHIPLLFRTRNTWFIDREINLGDHKYDCFVLSEERSISSDYMRKIINENLNEYGYVCGFGNPYSSERNAGKLILVMKDNPSLIKDGFYVFLKNRKKSFVTINSLESENISEEEYGNFLRGKSVVLVGPASSMIGRNLGEYIDSFDVVIRTNNMINTLMNEQEASKDFGKRTDILYVNVTYERDMLDVWRMEEWKKRGLKYVCRLMKTDLGKKGISTRWRGILKNPLPPPTTYLGTRAIWDLLSFDLKKLYVTGMDAYENVSDVVDGKNREYIEGYLPPLEIERRNNRIGGKLSLHDRYRDTRFILKSEEENSKMEIDLFCKKRMKKVLKNENKS